MLSGAGDVIDVLVEGTASARAVVQRVCQRQEERQRELALIRAGYDVARWTWKDTWPNDAPTMCRELARHGIHPTGVRW